MVPIILSSCLTQNETKIGRENYEGSTLLVRRCDEGRRKDRAFQLWPKQFIEQWTRCPSVFLRVN